VSFLWSTANFSLLTTSDYGVDNFSLVSGNPIVSDGSPYNRDDTGMVPAASRNPGNSNAAT
jgi:hypothetical protein